MDQDSLCPAKRMGAVSLGLEAVWGGIPRERDRRHGPAEYDVRRTRVYHGNEDEEIAVCISSAASPRRRIVGDKTDQYLGLTILLLRWSRDDMSRKSFGVQQR
jgi:hypothetical protein